MTNLSRFVSEVYHISLYKQILLKFIVTQCCLPTPTPELSLSHKQVLSLSCYFDGLLAFSPVSILCYQTEL